MAEAVAPAFSLVGGFMRMRGQQQQADAQSQAAAGQMLAAGQQVAAAQESERLAMQNAALVEAETREQVRREEERVMREQARRKATVSAMGRTTYGSAQDTLDVAERIEEENIAWLGKSGLSRARLAVEQGRFARQQGEAQAAVTAAQAGATQTQADVAETRGWTELARGAQPGITKIFEWAALP